MANTTEKNYADAPLALYHVKNNIVFGAVNSPYDVVTTLGVNLFTNFYARAEGGVSDLMNNTNADAVGAVLREARISINWGSGNCQEQSSVAFAYLYNLGTRPIEIMTAPMDIRGHVFVVIGRDESVPKRGMTQKDGKRVAYDDPTTWNPETVICDPWNNKVFYGKDYFTVLKYKPSGLIVRVQ